MILNTSSNLTAPAKLTLLLTEKAIEKLQLRGCHSQAAEIILKTPARRWSADSLKSLINGLTLKKVCYLFLIHILISYAKDYILEGEKHGNVEVSISQITKSTRDK